MKDADAAVNGTNSQVRPGQSDFSFRCCAAFVSDLFKEHKSRQVPGTLGKCLTVCVSNQTEKE